MLSRITKGLLWAAVLFRNPVAAHESVVQRAAFTPLLPANPYSLDASIINQTPLDLANAVQPQVIQLNAPIHSQSQPRYPSYYSQKNAQPNLDRLAGYVEYLLGAFVVAPMAVVLGYLGIKKINHYSKSQIKPRVSAVSERAVPPTRNAGRSAWGAAPPPSVLGAPVRHSSPRKKADDRTFVKTERRKAITADILAKLEQRRVAAAMRAAKSVTPVKTKTSPAIRKAALLKGSTQTINQPVVASSSALSAVPSRAEAAKPVASLPHPNRKTQRAYLKLVRENASKLVTVARRSRQEEKPDDGSSRTWHLLALYRLHRYNLSVLDFMRNYPCYQTRCYESLVLPLRLELAHFSHALSEQAVKETVASLQVALADFARVQNNLSLSETQNFINSINVLLQDTPLGQKCTQRTPAKRNKSQLAKNRNADAAYTDFVGNFIPRMEMLATKIRMFDKEAENFFSSKDYIHAFGMLIMMSCDLLPVHVLMRLRKHPEGVYAADVLSFMGQVHAVRNIVAHRLEPLSEMLVRFICDRVSYLSSVLPNEPASPIPPTSLVRASSAPMRSGGSPPGLFGANNSPAARPVSTKEESNPLVLR